MRYLILVLCLVFINVDASDWLNRTVRVDLIVDHINVRAFDPKYDSLIHSERISDGVNATNGEFPWIIYTTAWSGDAGGARIGIPCAGSIINNNFVLSDFYCVGRE